MTIIHTNGFERMEIASPGYITLQDVIAICIEWVGQRQVSIIFIDYLQLIYIENMLDKHLRIAMISEALKKLSFELEVPIFIRVPVVSANKDIITLRNLRKVGAIETFADCIMLINKLHKHSSSSNVNHTRKMLVRICKNHHGQLETIQFDSLLHIQKVQETLT